ncbi:GNAT family N-acetyltransferase [Rhizobium sp. TRM95111]|uniref:GNAT family N-acetyltransferase n=1 Tax=Rhizobium alarense TaxID=2846851 RepID=UPI001F45CFA6|nr:GNAT family N-acetyltransferase [Rhizobium alarense]MCF3639512.1 GNAT family N-acetyltransferase [Rhizobium alarense]
MNKHYLRTVPTLETRRLILRSHRIEDFDSYAALWADEGVVRHIGSTPANREEAWARMLRMGGLWHHMGFGFLTLIERETGTLIGEAGFLDLHRDMQPSTEGTLEAGWIVAPAWQRRGYAFEAVSALIEWAGPRFPCRPMTCIIDPDNEPSLRLAFRLGFAEKTRTAYQGSEVILLERPETPPAAPRSAP